MWKDLLKNDEELKDYYEKFYLQGSYATSTAIKPINGGEFDVDTILVLDIDEKEVGMKPKDALKFLADRMKTNKKYKDKIKVKDRCVTVDYKDDFHIDIVLSKPTDSEVILIPCKSDNDWKETNPYGFKEWCKTINYNTNGEFCRIAKMIKYWRDTKVGKDTAPKSILLTTIIGENMVGKNSDAESLVETLENIVENIDNIINEETDQPYVENPSLEGENLARDWNREKFDIFKIKLEKFTKDSRDALEENDEDKSIEKWQDIFGTTFPSQLSEGASMAKSISEGTAYIDHSGHINRNIGTKIPEHRFYGEVIHETKR
ncbi:nucleotidyltransferase [Senegalia massiliensis]|uniref:Nucleotidyltransferase n=1 Tax=Senegalia massiliensis TaxID=1720316 RepID=A0A845QX66_9CLOT|nr:nucleotidyltransferase [Senegalia massiliensis]